MSEQICDLTESDLDTISGGQFYPRYTCTCEPVEPGTYRAAILDMIGRANAIVHPD